jgi:hypothetical protein
MRPDRIEAAFWAGIARNVATTAETKDTGAVPVAGGYAVVVQGSDLAIAIGIGTRRPLRSDDLATIGAFFAQRGLPARVELTSDVYERDGALLTGAGYVPEERLTVYVRDPLEPLETPDLAPVAGLKRAAWIAAFGSGLDAHAASALTAIRAEAGFIAGAAVAVSGDTALVLQWQGPGEGPAAASALLAGLAAAQSRGATRAYLKLTDGHALASIAETLAFRPVETRARLRIAPGG